MKQAAAEHEEMVKAQGLRLNEMSMRVDELTTEVNRVWSQEEWQNYGEQYGLTVKAEPMEQQPADVPTCAQPHGSRVGASTGAAAQIRAQSMPALTASRVGRSTGVLPPPAVPEQQ